VRIGMKKTIGIILLIMIIVNAIIGLLCFASIGIIEVYLI
jgi:hypothetical protein